MKLNSRTAQAPAKKRKRKGPPRITADMPATWLVVALDGSSLEIHRDALQDLARGRHSVRIAYGRGSVPEELQRRSHQILTQRSVKGLPTGRLSRLLTSPIPVSRRIQLAGRDRWLRRVAPQSDEILLLDVTDEKLLASLRALAPGARLWLPHQVDSALSEEAAWRRLVFEARRVDATPEGGRRALSPVLDPGRRVVEDHQARGGRVAESFRPGADVRPELRRIARWAMRGGKFWQTEELLRIAEVLDAYFGPSSKEGPALRALQAHLDLVHGRPPAGDSTQLAKEVLDQADAALAEGELDEAVELGAVAYALLFHQQLHTAVASTPLVTDPDRFLEPLRSSAFARTVSSSPASVPDEASPPRAATPGARLRVTMLPGVYSNHAVPLIEALRQDDRADVTVLKPSTRAFGGLMVDPLIVRHRLAHALGQEVDVLGIPAEEVELVEQADVVVADWADKGCVWASTVVRPHTRFVVRVHSVDALGAPAHLVDWKQVDDIIFVSDHIRDVFNALLGERLHHVRQHVVTNIIPPEKFSAPLHEDAERTLGMVGWAQVVKDPSFALDILEILLQDDPSWRLRLIGSDFDNHHAAHAQNYAEEFRRRALGDGLVDHIDYTGFTRRLPEQLRHVGYILSTSLRESCPVGALEGTAAGAFPVVREWPAFSPYEGAKKLFPRENVITTPEEAAALILSVADDGERFRAAAAVREKMSDRFSEAETQSRMLDVILRREP